MLNSKNAYKAQHDKIKRKALLAPNATGQDVSMGFGGGLNHAVGGQTHEDQQVKGRIGMGFGSNTVDLGAVIGGMEANGVSSYLRYEYTSTDPHLADSEDTDCEPYNRNTLCTSAKHRLGSTPRTSTSKESN
jgi:hypothetical protein